MRKILTRASSKVKAETPRTSLPWISVATVSALALGFSALPLNITNGHMSLNQTQAASNGNGGDNQGNGGGSQSNVRSGRGSHQGPSTAGGGGGPGSGNPGGGQEGGLGGGSAGPSDSRGGDKGRDTPSIDRPEAPALGRPDTGGGNGTGNSSSRGNDVVSESGKAFAPGPAQGRGADKPSGRVDTAVTANIQQRVGDQSGPDLDSNAEAALIERGWKR